MAERPRVKGKGREIFLGKETETANQETAKTVRRKAVEVEKMTFYLPPELSDRLDELKIKLRGRHRRERKVSKSEIVRIALESSLREWADDLESFPQHKLPSR